MKKIDSLINTIVQSIKGAHSKNSDRTYTDEPIIFTASQMKNYTPPKYIAMRKIASNGYSGFQSNAGIFCQQAKFMEYFEDSFDYHGDFVRYFPTYQAMNIMQLRGYFSWRTKVRSGIIEKAPLSFAFVYIYELLNQIGVISPEDGFFKLKSFADEYGRIDSKINGYVHLWLKDFVIYNGLDRSLLDGFRETAVDSSLSVLMNYKSKSEHEVFEALNSLSTYNLEKSSFYKKFPADIESAVYAVYSNLSDYYSSGKRKNSLNEKLFGKSYKSAYFIFNSAVFYEPKKHPDCVYEVSDISRYICRDGDWFCESFFRFGSKSAQIGAILKNIDYTMRIKCGYKSTLKPAESTKIFLKIIDETIDSVMREKKKRERPKIEIDASKLSGIRAAAMKTQSKLIVDEGETENEAEPPAPVQSPQEAEDICGLTAHELALLRCLLDGGDWRDMLRENGLMLSVLVDSINEKLFDLLGDTAIDCSADIPEIIEDYADELKGLICR